MQGAVFAALMALAFICPAVKRRVDSYHGKRANRKPTQPCKLLSGWRTFFTGQSHGSANKCSSDAAHLLSESSASHTLRDASFPPELTSASLFSVLRDSIDLRLLTLLVPALTAAGLQAALRIAVRDRSLDRAVPHVIAG